MLELRSIGGRVSSGLPRLGRERRVALHRNHLFACNLQYPCISRKNFGSIKILKFDLTFRIPMNVPERPLLSQNIFGSHFIIISCRCWRNHSEDFQSIALLMIEHVVVQRFTRGCGIFQWQSMSDHLVPGEVRSLPIGRLLFVAHKERVRIYYLAVVLREVV